MKLTTYWRVWKKLTRGGFLTYLSNRLDVSCFLLGKIARFFLFLLVIRIIFEHSNTLAGYTQTQIILFFITFYCLDTLSQALYRGMYPFADELLQGNFDFVLTRPCNPLFYSLFRQTDLLDLITLVPLLSILVFVIHLLGPVNTIHLLAYLFFFICSFLISTSLHIISGALCIFTQENDNFLMLYRRALIVGVFPGDILSTNWRFILTYLLPVLVISTFPAKAFLGNLTLGEALGGLTVTGFFFVGSLLLWRASLKYYAGSGH